MIIDTISFDVAHYLGKPTFCTMPSRGGMRAKSPMPLA